MTICIIGSSGRRVVSPYGRFALQSRNGYGRSHVSSRRWVGSRLDRRESMASTTSLCHLGSQDLAISGCLDQTDVRHVRACLPARSESVRCAAALFQIRDAAAQLHELADSPLMMSAHKRQVGVLIARLYTGVETGRLLGQQSHAERGPVHSQTVWKHQ